MQIHSDDKKPSAQMLQSSVPNNRLRAIAYSMDALIPGLYIWLGAIKIRIGVVCPKKIILAEFIVRLVWHWCYQATGFIAPIRVVMTLDKHKIDGVPQITSKTLPVAEFDTLLLQAGYSKIGSAPAQGGRIKTWWSHPTFARVEAI